MNFVYVYIYTVKPGFVIIDNKPRFIKSYKRERYMYKYIFMRFDNLDDPALRVNKLAITYEMIKYNRYDLCLHHDLTISDYIYFESLQKMPQKLWYPPTNKIQLICLIIFCDDLSVFDTMKLNYDDIIENIRRVMPKICDEQLTGKEAFLQIIGKNRLRREDVTNVKV